MSATPKQKKQRSGGAGGVPFRIRLSRRKGSRKPEGAVNVARPTIWGNPFHCYTCLADVGKASWSRSESVTLYRKWLLGEDVVPDDLHAYRPSLERVRRELKGKNLACWCPLDEPCHADVLLELANDSAALDDEPMHEKIFRVALEWCERNPAWKRICDIPDHEKLYLTWDELPAIVRRRWEHQYHSSAQDAWQEWGRKPCKVRYGFVATNGILYPQITDVPLNVNSCMVFRVGGGGVEPGEKAPCSISRQQPELAKCGAVESSSPAGKGAGSPDGA